MLNNPISLETDNMKRYELIVILLPTFDADRIETFISTVIDILYKLRIKAFIIKTWRNNLNTSTMLAWYLHFIVDTQFVLTTCVLKRIKQSIRFDGLITRWHLFSVKLNRTDKKPTVHVVNKLSEYKLSKDINMVEQNENISRCSNESCGIFLQELKWPWLLQPIDRYKNITILQNYITDYGEIMSRKVTKLNKKIHRKLCKEVKRYRNLGLISKTKPIPEVDQDSDI